MFEPEKPVPTFPEHAPAMLEPDIAWRLKCLHHQIRCDAAAQKVLRLLREIRDRRLEEKYRPDQPRAPRGTPIGGQWIVDPSSARQRLLRETYLVADLTPDGQLDPRTFRPASEDNSPLAQAKRYLVQRTAEFLDYFVKRQQEDPDGLEDVLKVARLLDPSDLILNQVLSEDQKIRIAELVDNAAEGLKPYLDEVVTRLETGQVDDETALFLTAGAVIAVGKYAPKAAKTRAFAKIGTVLRRIVARIGLARKAVKPVVIDAKLKNFVENVYKGVSNPQRIGDGTLGAAVRYEVRTGQPVQGLWHQTKARETIRGLKRWLKRNPDATTSDRQIAIDIISDLEKALRGQ